MVISKKDGPKEGAKRRQAAFTERQKAAGLLKWQKWVTPTEAAALDALLSQLMAGAQQPSPQRTSHPQAIHKPARAFAAVAAVSGSVHRPERLVSL